jgi:hypothetical protein
MESSLTSRHTLDTQERQLMPQGTVEHQHDIARLVREIIGIHVVIGVDERYAIKRVEIRQFSGKAFSKRARTLKLSRADRVESEDESVTTLANEPNSSNNPTDHIVEVRLDGRRVHVPCHIEKHRKHHLSWMIADDLPVLELTGRNGHSKS